MGQSPCVLRPAMQGNYKRTARIPIAAWDDVSGTKLDPKEVMKARKVEIEHAEKKTVKTMAGRSLRAVRLMSTKALTTILCTGPAWLAKNITTR